MVRPANPETTGYTVFGMDFDAAGTLYVVDNDSKTLGTLDPVTSAFTTIAAISGDYPLANTNIGLDVVSPTEAYVADTDNLYSIDLTTGVTALIGSFGLAADEFAIDIASDSSGNLFAFVIFDRAVDGTDNGRLYSVNTATAATSLIGMADVDDINFAQGCDFDPDTDILYVGILHRWWYRNVWNLGYNRRYYIQKYLTTPISARTRDGIGHFRRHHPWNEQPLGYICDVHRWMIRLPIFVDSSKCVESVCDGF